MRNKEEAHDYRYFPDPDLVPISIGDDDLNAERSNIIELPYEKEERFVAQYSLRIEDVLILTSEEHLADYFELSVKAGAEPSDAAKWILGEILSIVNENGMSIGKFPVSPDHFAGLLLSVKSGTISNATGKTILRKMVVTDMTATEIIQNEGLTQVSDKSSVSEIVLKVLMNNPDAVSYTHLTLPTILLL